MATISEIGMPDAGLGILTPHPLYTVSLLQMLYRIKLRREELQRTADLGGYCWGISEYSMPEDIKMFRISEPAYEEQISTRSKLDLNCAYVELFESKVYSIQEWNEGFTPWCRKRFNLVQHDLFYNEDGTSAHKREDMFHKRTKV